MNYFYVKPKVTKINKKICYNFSNDYLCRWCGSMYHKTECCCLN